MLIKDASRTWSLVLLWSTIAGVGCGGDTDGVGPLGTQQDSIINGEAFWPAADPANSGVVGWRRRDDQGFVHPMGNGVVIAGKRWILTAGHLLYRMPEVVTPDGQSITFSHPASEDHDQLGVMLGGLNEAWWIVEQDRELAKVPSYSEQPVSQVIFHPDFNPFVNFNEDSTLRVTDIALVRTKEELPLDWAEGNGGHVVFGGNTENLVDRTCMSVSFGPTLATVVPSPDSREVLRYAFFEVLGVRADTPRHRPGAAFAIGTTISSGVTQGIWNGDSGSPCFVNGRMAGVLTHWAFNPGIPVGVPVEGGYTKTERFRRWVSRIIAESGARDFTGDEQSDVFLQSRSTGNVLGMAAARAPGNSLDITFDAPNVLLHANGWTPVGTGDFDGDGRADFAFQWFGTGSTDPEGLVGFFLSESGEFIRSRPPRDLAYEVVGVADLDGDTISDLIWRNAVNGRTVFWSMNRLGPSTVPEQTIKGGAPFMGSATPLGPDWEIVAVADFDRYEFLAPELAMRDTPDILWRNTDTGELRLALMDYWLGTYGVRRQISILEASPDLTIGGIGDFNLDGWADTVMECHGSACDGGDGSLELRVRLNPHDGAAPDPARPWANFEFTQLVAQCRASDGTIGACRLDPDHTLLGPG
jgi:hypothetical protein